MEDDINPFEVEIAIPRDHEDERLDPMVAEALRAMTPGERLARAMALHKFGRELAEAGVRAQHPDWTDEQVHAEVLERMLGGAARAITLRD